MVGSGGLSAGIVVQECTSPVCRKTAGPTTGLRQVPVNSHSSCLSDLGRPHLLGGTLRARAGCMHTVAADSPTRDSPATVLIVDDEPGVRESLRAILMGEFAVQTAATGAEAFTLIETVPIDVVTLDLRMPGIGGIGILERIKAYDQDIEVLIITGYSSFDSAINGIRLRAFDYVSKPFDIEHVRRLVRSAVARRRAARGLRQARKELVANLDETFRTPLGVILGCAEMMQADTEGSLTLEQRRALGQIRSSSSSLLAYLEGITFLSALEGGELPLLREKVPIRDLFSRIWEKHRRPAAEKGLDFIVESPPDLAVDTDQRLLGKLLEELVENAIKFTERGEVSLLARAAGEAGVTISVHDTGVGIDPATAEVVAGHQSGNSVSLLRPPSRLALGLVKVAAISRFLGTGLHIKAEPDRGTECLLMLTAPRIKAPERALPPVAAAVSP